MRKISAILLLAALSLSGAAVLAAGGAVLEPGEDMPGGAATSNKPGLSRNAFSHPSANIGFEGELDFKIGNAMFRKVWVSAPSSTTKSDGLGPLFNSRSCQSCHLKDGRGHPPAANFPDDNAISMLLRLSVPPRTQEQRERLASGRANVIPEPVYGGQLQDHAIQGQRIEGRMHIDYEETEVGLADGEIVKLRKPSYRVTDLGYGALDPETMLSPRIAPQMIGLGLLEAIPEGDILVRADPNDDNGDGISGKASRVWAREDERVVLGRFGWKAGAPSVLDQAADAFAHDVGISSWLAPRPSGDCTQAQKTCIDAPNGRSGEDEEIDRELLGLVGRYSRNLAVPRRRNPENPDVLAGKALFADLGCAACHTPSFTTGPHDEEPHLADQKIWPYTDLLLHDMGEGLADNRPEGVATGSEWRTAPLWGIGLTEEVSGHTFFLHDGRARNLIEAILWHGGEARAARDRFTGLDRQDREHLLAFLNSL